jgi:hypothetical protein
MPNDNDTPPPAETFTTQQLHAAIEKARSEEREKLRNQLEQATTEVTSLKADVVRLNAELKKTADELSAIKAAAKPDGGIDIEKVIEQTTSAAVNRVNSEWSQKFQELQSELNVEKNTRQKLTLEQIKAKIIAESNGQLIPEMVVGSTEDELKASAERSKQVFARTIAAAGVPNLQQNSNGGGGSPGLPILPHGGGTPPSNNRAKDMPMSEYAKERNNLKRSVAGRYAANYISQ